MRKLVAVLALLACTGFAVACSAEPSTGSAPRPSISVTGTGKVFYVPDMGTMHAGVSADGWTAAEAWKKNEEIVATIFAEVKKLGIDQKDIKTDNLSVQPRYHQKQNEEPKFRGYTVRYDLSVTVRKLDQMSVLLDRMVQAGANRNMNVSFGYSKLDELIDEARTKAVAEARKKANLYTTGAGARLGDVLNITEGNFAPQYRMLAVDAEAIRAGQASMPVAGGEQQLSTTITVTWAIDNTKELLHRCPLTPAEQPQIPLEFSTPA
jgi:uncharacterized protein YggE